MPSCASFHSPAVLYPSLSSGANSDHRLAPINHNTHISIPFDRIRKHPFHSLRLLSFMNMQSEGQLNPAAWADIDDEHSNGPNAAGKVTSEAAAADGEGEDELFANFKTMEEEQQRKVGLRGSRQQHNCLKWHTSHAPQCSLRPHSPVLLISSTRSWTECNNFHDQ